MSDPYAEIEVLRMQLGLTLDRANEAEARERVLQQRVEELEWALLQAERDRCAKIEATP